MKTKWIYTQDEELLNVSKISSFEIFDGAIRAAIDERPYDIISYSLHSWDSWDCFQQAGKEKQEEADKHNRIIHKRINNVYSKLVMFLQDDSKSMLFVGELINNAYEEMD